MEETIENKTVAEFFAGIGLMRAGLEQSGWTTVLANDIDPTKRRSYLNHFIGSGDDFILEDIHKLSAEVIPQVDLATASFPCTDLSLAGRQASLQGEHSSAFWGFIDILQGMGNRKPSLILLENVAGFLTSNNGQDFQDALKALNNQGYSVDAFIIDAVHFVPQSRVRLFIVGKLTREKFIPISHYFPETEIRPAKLIKFIYDNPEINWSINHNLPILPKVNNNLESIIEKVSKSSSLWWNKDRVEYLLNQTFERHFI